MRGALLRYRIMAYLVGCLLVVLVCVGLPLKYGPWQDDTVVLFTAIPHGWLYMVLLITAFDLGRRARWTWTRLLLIALAGTVPFLSFVAERSATRDVKAKLATQEADLHRLAEAVPSPANESAANESPANVFATDESPTAEGAGTPDASPTGSPADETAVNQQVDSRAEARRVAE